MEERCVSANEAREQREWDADADAFYEKLDNDTFPTSFGDGTYVAGWDIKPGNYSFAVASDSDECFIGHVPVEHRHINPVLPKKLRQSVPGVFPRYGSLDLDAGDAIAVKGCEAMFTKMAAYDHFFPNHYPGYGLQLPDDFEPLAYELVQWYTPGPPTAQPALPVSRVYATCADAAAAGEPKIQGTKGAGMGFVSNMVPSERDGDEDGVVCERR